MMQVILLHGPYWEFHCEMLLSLGGTTLSQNLLLNTGYHPSPPIKVTVCMHHLVVVFSMTTETIVMFDH